VTICKKNYLYLLQTEYWNPRTKTRMIIKKKNIHIMSSDLKAYYTEWATQYLHNMNFTQNTHLTKARIRKVATKTIFKMYKWSGFWRYNSMSRNLNKIIILMGIILVDTFNIALALPSILDTWYTCSLFNSCEPSNSYVVSIPNSIE